MWWNIVGEMGSRTALHLQHLMSWWHCITLQLVGTWQLCTSVFSKLISQIDILTTTYMLLFLYQCHRTPSITVFALRFQNLPDRNSTLKIFKHEKEEKLAGPKGKLAGPAQFLVAEGLGPALNAKTAISQHWQVMAWCCQATSHYLSQYWSRSVLSYMASLGHNKLTLNVWGPSYLSLTTIGQYHSCWWPWLLASPGYQQPWYWLCTLE